MAVATLTLDALRARWIGRAIFGTSDHRLLGQRPGRVIKDIHYNPEFQQYIAFAGEHVVANSVEALDRRLHQLSGS